MDVLRAKVRIGGWILSDTLFQSLELAFADVGEALPLRPRRGPGVEIDRDGEFSGGALAQATSEHYTIVHRRVAHRHERDDVRRPHPRVFATVLRHVDSLGRDPHGR